MTYDYNLCDGDVVMIFFKSTIYYTGLDGRPW